MVGSSSSLPPRSPGAVGEQENFDARFLDLAVSGACDAVEVAIPSPPIDPWDAVFDDDEQTGIPSIMDYGVSPAVAA
jgi:hypothetical protein